MVDAVVVEKLCEQWLVFKNMFELMDHVPQTHQRERIHEW